MFSQLLRQQSKYPSKKVDIFLKSVYRQFISKMSGGRKELFEYFDKLGIQSDTVEHPEVFTVEAMMPHVGNLPGAVCKNLFLRDKKKKGLWLLTALHDRQIVLNEIAKNLGAGGGLRLADESLMVEKLGVGQGCATPLALFNDTEGAVKCVLDADLIDGGHEKIYSHPMVNTATTGISPQDFMKFLRETGHEPIMYKFE